MTRKNKFAWQEEREEEISYEFQNRLSEREHETEARIEKIKKIGTENLRKKITAKKERTLVSLQEKIKTLQQRIESLNEEIQNARSTTLASLAKDLEAMKQSGLESLRKRVSDVRTCHAATIQRMQAHYELQLQKIRRGRKPASTSEES